MSEMAIRNAMPIDATKFAPPTALTVKLRITVTPQNGAVLVYSPDKSIVPIEFVGPVSVHDVPYSDILYGQLVRGATDFGVKGVGYKDDLTT